MNLVYFFLVLYFPIVFSIKISIPLEGWQQDVCLFDGSRFFFDCVCVCVHGSNHAYPTIYHIIQKSNYHTLSSQFHRTFACGPTERESVRADHTASRYDVTQR
jgi:hypothetical protein